MTRSSHPVLTGRPRLLGDGQRPWRAALYAPAGRYQLHRVVFKEADEDEWTWTARTAPSEAEARTIFHQVERALDAMSAPPARASIQRARTGDALAEAYLADSRAQGKAVRTIEQREGRLRRHVRPVLGELPVAQWRVAHSRRVITDPRPARDRVLDEWVPLRCVVLGDPAPGDASDGAVDLPVRRQQTLLLDRSFADVKPGYPLKGKGDLVAGLRRTLAQSAT